MRQIATLPEESAARKFADYLLTLKIETQLNREGSGVEVWVCDEDRVEQARQELEAFTRNPTDPRYSQAVPAAQALRRQEAQQEQEYNRRQSDLETVMSAPGDRRQGTLTLALVAASVIATLLTNFGKDKESAIFKGLSIAPYQEVSGGAIEWYGLTALFSGEVWRVITPIFLHFDPLHLIFNMFWLFALGSQIEASRGTLKLLGLVLVTAATSNVCEYYVSWSLNRNLLPVWSVNPAFGGMSGVVYGLFGYLWMKSRYEPKLGLMMSPETVVIMLGWFVVCLMGVVGPVANVAHGVGLLVGVAIGVVPHLWRG